MPQQQRLIELLGLEVPSGPESLELLVEFFDGRLQVRQCLPRIRARLEAVT